METRPNPDHDSDDLVVIFIRILKEYWRTILTWSAALTVFTALVGGFLFWKQSTRWTASVGFRPLFTGVEKGLYPNDLPFGPSDITSASVMDDVYSRNGIQDFCGRDDFRSGFFVELTPSSLDTEYQAKLSNPQLAGPDRERLQNEYLTRRATVPIHYELTFVRSAACTSLPNTVIFKALDDVLSTWAEEAETKRGVLKLRVPILTPNIFDVSNGGGRGLFTKTVLLNSALNRALANVRQVQALPGAELVRYGDKKISFGEIELRLEDLVDESLMALGGASFGTDASRWAEESLATANGKSQAAEARVQIYLSALREYSGLASTRATATATSESERNANASAVQSFIPQVDRTVIDRFAELLEANVTFRQELTRSLVDESVKALESRTKVDYYEKLLKSLHRSTSKSPAEIQAALNEIIGDAKESMSQFVALYDEFSRVAFKPATAMYRIEQPPQIVVLRTFSLRGYQIIVLGAFVISLFVAFVACLTYDQFLRSPASEAHPID